MKKIFIFLFSLLLITGCKIKDAEEPVSESPPKETGLNNTLKQTIYKGMYSYSENSGRFSECGSGKKFVLSPLGANKTLDSVFSSSPVMSKKKIFINAEGFSSVDQKKNGKGFDTVLVITRIISTDSTYICN